MDRWNRSRIRWHLVAYYLGIVTVLLACAAGEEAGIIPTPSATEEKAVLRLENGAIELREETGNWVPVGGETTFEIAGQLEGTDPWMVTGNTFGTREWTQIDEELEAGDPVRVEGVILEDATWLASSIELVEEPTSPMIALVGKVTSINPWIVNGIALNLTSDTLISEGIEPEMIVRVEILLLEDGIWEVLSIVALSDFTDVPGCATVTETVVSVNGNQIQLAGWPAITLSEEVKIEDDQGVEATLSSDQGILAVVCSSEAGQIRITHIIILGASESETSLDEEGDKVLICHKPDKNGGHTLRVASAAVSAHLAHGDKMGACP